MRVAGQLHDPAALPPGKARYTMYRRLGGPQGRSGRVNKYRCYWGRAVRTVASRYPDCALPAHIALSGVMITK
jgi:hypothetical protein